MKLLARITTLVTALAIFGGLALLVRSGVRDVSVGGNLRTYVLLRDGARVAAGSPVVIAGVRVGDIERVSLEGGMARVDLRLRDDIRIPQASIATRRADKLFGDSYIEIIPGSDPEAPLLRSGQRILHVREGSSADTILRGIDQALPKADRALELTREAAVSSRQWVGGPLADGLARSQAWLDSGRLSAPINALDESVATIDELTVRAEGALRGAEPEVLGALDRVDRGLRTLRDGLATAQGSIGGLAESTARGLAELDPVVRDVSDVLVELDDPRSRGTLARLINDPELADDLDDAVRSGAELVRDSQRFRVLLGLRLEYNVFARGPRAVVAAELWPRPDSFYYIEATRVSQGGPPEVSLRADGTPGYVRSIEIGNAFRITAQIGKRLGPLALRGGLKESQFGAGLDLSLGGRLRLSADLFGRSFSGAPNLRLAAALAVFRSVYVIGGLDQVLTEPGDLPIAAGNAEVPRVARSVHYGRDVFVGASVSLSEEDLAMLLRVYGALLVGLL